MCALGSTEAALMGNFTPISRRPAKSAMRTARVHSGALRAPLCTQGDVMAHFACQREIGVKFPMRAASVDPKSTQHTPLTITKMIFRTPKIKLIFDFSRPPLTSFFLFYGPGARKTKKKTQKKTLYTPLTITNTQHSYA